MICEEVNYFPARLVSTAGLKVVMEPIIGMNTIQMQLREIMLPKVLTFRFMVGMVRLFEYFMTSDLKSTKLNAIPLLSKSQRYLEIYDSRTDCYIVITINEFSVEAITVLQERGFEDDERVRALKGFEDVGDSSWIFRVEKYSVKAKNIRRDFEWNVADFAEGYEVFWVSNLFHLSKLLKSTYDKGIRDLVSAEDLFVPIG